VKKIFAKNISVEKNCHPKNFWYTIIFWSKRYFGEESKKKVKHKLGLSSAKLRACV